MRELFIKTLKSEEKCFEEHGVVMFIGVYVLDMRLVLTSSRSEGVFS